MPCRGAVAPENAVLRVFTHHPDADHYTTLAEMLASSVTQQAEPVESTWRGVFSVQHKRTLIFTQVLELRIRDLPRWKPQVFVSRRVREATDE